ncbi:MAG: peptide ABC transporter substrate-binding protein [bacterium]|nr:peptide ABC transporter substrate-binding protein [bacterium]
MDSFDQKINKLIQGSAKAISRVIVFNPFKKGLLSRASLRTRADKNLVYSLAPTTIPRREQLKHLAKLLDPREKMVLKISLLLLVVSFSFLGYRFYSNNLILFPRVGGTYSEGVVGYPQTINPLYASSRDVDADLARLIYSSLFSYDASGRLSPDLASGWIIEDGGKAYTVTLREGVKWQNGELLTVNDILFTFDLIKNPEFRSPLRASLNGAEIEKVDERSVKFILAEPYADFLSLLTFGIMPQNAWEMILPEAAALTELNLKPVGSGLYKFESLIKSKGGSIKEYHLIVNPDYYGTKPYIEKLIIKFYPDYIELVRALNANEVDGASYVPDDLKKDLIAKHSLSIHNLHLPQVNAIFFNQSKNKALADLKVRQALSYAINRERMIEQVLGGAAVVANGPILAEDYVAVPESNIYNFDSAKAEQLLEEAGYKRLDITTDILMATEKSAEAAAAIAQASSTAIEAIGYWRVGATSKQPLVVKLSVPENGRLDVAESIKNDWEAVGVKVVIDKVSASAVNSEMVATHNFEAFLYGQVVGFEPDIASFWHSSQVGGQGLNLSSYNNSAVDALLTEARQAADNVALRLEKYTKIQETITADIPAVFLYSPDYTYVQAKRVRGFSGTAVSEPYDRFAGIADWYLKTKKRIAW